MIVRKIRPEEVKRTMELFAISFEFANNIEKSAQEIYEEVSTTPHDREDFYWQERWAAFEDDDKTMMSYFIAQPFPVVFDGQIYDMRGIGGVATLPQYRKSGGIRKCFEAVLPDMYQNGVAFSYLYPFSTAYYRKFGYEMGCEKLQYHVSLSHLKPYAVTGKCFLAEPGNFMLEDIKAIYRTWQSKYNMMIANEDYEYAWVEKSNPVKDQEFTYVYKSESGEPMGYMTVKQIVESDGRNVTCPRLCFTCPEGLKGLLNILISLGTDHAHATFEVPGDVDLTLLLPEWSMGAISLRKIWNGMVRVVNVEKVLRGARYIGSGSVKIGIKDPQIAENNGVFEVTFEDGICKDITICGCKTCDGSDACGAGNACDGTDAQADVTMTINEFSRLIIGTSDASSLAYMERVTVHNSSAPLSQVFYKKPTMIVQFF